MHSFKMQFMKNLFKYVVNVVAAKHHPVLKTLPAMVLVEITNLLVRLYHLFNAMADLLGTMTV